jgi:hypothetical protein
MDRRGVKPGGGRLANKLKQKNQGGQEAELPQDNLQASMIQMMMMMIIMIYKTYSFSLVACGLRW